MRPFFAWNMECGNNGDPDTVGGCWLLWDLYWQNVVVLYMHISFNSKLADSIISCIQSAYNYNFSSGYSSSYLYGLNADSVCEEGLSSQNVWSQSRRLEIANDFVDHITPSDIDDKILYRTQPALNIEAVYES